jgi:signal peptidase I
MNDFSETNGPEPGRDGDAAAPREDAPPPAHETPSSPAKPPEHAEPEPSGWGAPQSPPLPPLPPLGSPPPPPPPAPPSVPDWSAPQSPPPAEPWSFSAPDEAPAAADGPPPPSPYAAPTWNAAPDAYEPYRPYGDDGPSGRKRHRLPHGWRVGLDWLVTIVGAVAIVLAIKAWVVNPYRIPTPSMEPTLHCSHSVAEPSCRGRFSDRVLANRFIYHFRDPNRGDIVVFRAPAKAKTACSSGEGDVFVKRIIGMPGDIVSEKQGWIYINGKRLDEPYLRPSVHVEDRGNDFHGPITVPKGEYEMMGDNRNESCDSRTWGPVPRDSLIGKVFMTYWPPNRISLH